MGHLNKRERTQRYPVGVFVFIGKQNTSQTVEIKWRCAPGLLACASEATRYPMTLVPCNRTPRLHSAAPLSPKSNLNLDVETPQFHRRQTTLPTPSPLPRKPQERDLTIDDSIEPVACYHSRPSPYSIDASRITIATPVLPKALTARVAEPFRFVNQDLRA